MAMEKKISLPPPLSAKNPNSFAYPTMKDRIPVILSKIADCLARNKDEITQKYGGEPAREELKVLTGAISQLRYEVMTNKGAAPICGSSSDVSAWNSELKLETEKNDGEPPRWFDNAWLWMECYLYRRIHEAVQMSPLLRTLDVFESAKQEAFTKSYAPISTLTMYLLEAQSNLKTALPDVEIDKYFSEFLQMSLWGNKCDLSISKGQDNYQTQCPLDQLMKLKPYLLVDNTAVALQAIRTAHQQRGGKAGRVDIVLDNAGFELVTDLCLAEFLLSAGLASSIHFHAKAMPWFVSDVTELDFHWTLGQMRAMNHLAMSQLQESWHKRLQDGSWVLKSDSFWTMPNTYSQMKKICPELYSDLAQADLIFFKGDLNYRKLVGDLQWETTMNFSVTLQEFQPSALCALRTLKADVVVGLAPGQAEETEQKDKNWMTNGEWAVISISL